MKLHVRQNVTFAQNADHPAVPGVISRVWDNGKYVTIRTREDKPRTFVRLVSAVGPAFSNGAPMDLDRAQASLRRLDGTR